MPLLDLEEFSVLLSSFSILKLQLLGLILGFGVLNLQLLGFLGLLFQLSSQGLVLGLDVEEGF